MKLAALVLLVASACGDDDTPADSGPERDATDARPVFTPSAPMPPVAPAAPATPRFVDWDCPTGFDTVAIEGGPSVCAPYGAGERLTCGTGEAHFPGTMRCAAIDPMPCAIGEGDLYVRPGASGGTGTRDAPFARLADALAVAQPGDVIALAPGTYDSATEIATDVTILGACASETRIRHSASVAGSIESPLRREDFAIGATADVTLRRVTIEGLVAYEDGHVALENAVVTDAIRGLGVEGDATLRARDVVVVATPSYPMIGLVAIGRAAVTVERLAMFGVARAGFVAAEDAQLNATDIVIAGMHADQPTGTPAGVLMQQRARATIARLVVDSAAGNGISVNDDATLDLEDAHFRDLDATNDGGVALRSRHRSHVDARRVRIARGKQFGAICRDGGTLTLTDFTIDDVSTAPSTPAGGTGSAAIDGGTLTLSRGIVSGFGAIGVYASASRLTAADLVVREGRGDDPSLTHGSIIVANGGTAAIDRIAIDSFGEGLAVRRAGSTAVVHDVTVGPPGPRPDGVLLHGRAFNVFEGASLVLQRAWVEGHTDAAVVVTSSHAEVEDITVIDSAADMHAVGEVPGGLVFQVDSSGSVRRAALHTPRQLGVSLLLRADVDLEDVEVIEPRSKDLYYGRGLEIGEDSVASLARASIERAFDDGLQIDHGGRLDAQDVRVVGYDDETRGARGIAASTDAVVELDRVQLSRCGGLGIATFRGATITARNLEVRDTKVECDDDRSCANDSGGIGVAAFRGSRIEVDGFVSESNVTCGAAVDEGSTLALRHGRVVMNPIGVCVTGGPVEDGLVDDVELANEQNLSATTLPVPEIDSTALQVLQ